MGLVELMVALYILPYFIVLAMLFLKLINNKENITTMEKKTIYVDLDGVLADIAKQRDKRLAQNPDMKYPQATYGFFMEMEQIPDGVAAVKALDDHFDVWFLSAPSWKNPMCAAEKTYWIQKNFGIEWAEKLILCSDKSKCKGEYLIDDNATGRGQDKFKGELILFTGDWVSVFEYIIKKEKLETNK